MNLENYVELNPARTIQTKGAAAKHRPAIMGIQKRCL